MKNIYALVVILGALLATVIWRGELCPQTYHPALIDYAQEEFNKGVAAYRRGDLNAAETHFLASYHSVRYSKASFNLSFIYYKLNRPLEANNYVQRCLNDPPPIQGRTLTIANEIIDWIKNPENKVDLGGSIDGVQAEFVEYNDGVIGPLGQQILEDNPYYDFLHKRVALRSIQSGKYVCGGFGSEGFLAASCENLMPGAEFLMIDLGDNLFALQSVLSNRYVRADTTRQNYLLVNSVQIGPQEKFMLIYLENSQVAIKSFANGLYVRAGMRAESYLAAQSPEIRGWETFDLIYLN